MNNPESRNQSRKSVANQFKDVSRFTRFVYQMDEQDKQLNPRRRKRKWILVLSSMLVLYLLSFLLPSPDFFHRSIVPAELTLSIDSVKKQRTETPEAISFEMPVDSFENLLKQQVHERLPEKK